MTSAEDVRYIKGLVTKTHFAHQREFSTILEFVSLHMSA